LMQGGGGGGDDGDDGADTFISTARSHHRA
jgi:hypothetical protein